MISATRDGAKVQVSAPSLVGDLDLFLATLQTQPTVVGFDFPIGFPPVYASRANIRSFLDVFSGLGSGEWKSFYEIAATPSEISVYRPFYPRSCSTKGMARHEHLVHGLGVEAMADLLRKCELKRDDRNAACSLFWTLGGNQVGRAAISGWRDVVAPLLRDNRSRTHIWPFDGKFQLPASSGEVVIVETYPAEACLHVGLLVSRGQWSKRRQVDRQSQAASLLHWAEHASVELHKDLRDQITDGFGDSSTGEDRFDATVGLFGMIEVISGRRPSGEPDDASSARSASRCLA
jgi:hypothetical protein